MTLWGEVKGNFDVAFGEIFTIKPRRKSDVNARPLVDSTRPQTDFTGVWRDPHARIYPHSPGHADSTAERWGSDKPTVDFDTAALSFDVAEGDVIVRPSTGTAYEVTDVALDGFTRTTLSLSAARRA